MDLGTAFDEPQETVNTINAVLRDDINVGSTSKIDSEPTRKRRPDQTWSNVGEDVIYGRDHDKESIVRELLAPNDQGGVSILSIVGVGGLGKTALARLVYNDPRVKDAFPLRLWTCACDQDQKVLDVKSILAEFLFRSQDRSTMEQLQSEVQALLAGKKYLLVLDDVWTESHHQWCQLADYLIGGARGSWIVVTTRSEVTAEITGGLKYCPSGLTEENSWSLFERTAFGSDQSNPPDELVEIGRKIVDRCYGVPLAIRVAATLLYGQDTSKWQSLQIGLADMRDGNNSIMTILMRSFLDLEERLKDCFRYCALFPKDFVLKKETLIRLWMAQGLLPLDEDQSIEDTGEEFFSFLAWRCFFRNFRKDEFGEIESCNIHDLMHDVAQEAAGREIRPLDTSGNVDKYIRHLSISDKNEYEIYYSLGRTDIRSLVFYHCKTEFSLDVRALVAKFGCLRVLDLSGKKLICLPDSIGELLHLRYLDLSRNKALEALPNSITNLFNLQTLLLYDCDGLKELPVEFSRLVKLRVLDIERCSKLTSMPRGMGKLTCLRMLKGEYRVGGGGSCTSWEQCFDGLQDLKTLTNLKDELKISMQWPNNAENDARQDIGEGLYLSNMVHLNAIYLKFINIADDGRTEDEGITMKLMENLRPHSNLKRLCVGKYHGVEMPGWITHLPNLVSLTLFDCKELKHLPCLGNLRHLKSLRLDKLSNLEYIEVEMVSFFPSLELLSLNFLTKFKGWRRGPGVGMEESSNSSNNQPHLPQCFSQLKELYIFNCPSIEFLYSEDLPKFEGWRSGAGVAMEESSNSSNNQLHLQQCLPQLKQLHISGCPNMTCILLCPMLETLSLRHFNERLEIHCTKILPPSQNKVNILIEKFSNFLSKYSIYFRRDVVEEKSGTAVIQNPEYSGSVIVPNLRKVTVDNAAWLNSMSKEYFSSLQTLCIDKDYEMVELPSCLQYMSTLRFLTVLQCTNLKAMPNWMPKLTSLEHLTLYACSKELEKRCQVDPPGEDWQYIEHILLIKVSN